MGIGTPLGACVISVPDSYEHADKPVAIVANELAYPRCRPAAPDLPVPGHTPDPAATAERTSPAALTDCELEVPGLGGAGLVERRDHRSPGARPCHRQDPRQPLDDKTRPPRPCPTRRRGIPQWSGTPVTAESERLVGRWIQVGSATMAQWFRGGTSSVTDGQEKRARSSSWFRSIRYANPTVRIRFSALHANGRSGIAEGWAIVSLRLGSVTDRSRQCAMCITRDWMK